MFRQTQENLLLLYTQPKTMPTAYCLGMSAQAKDRLGLTAPVNATSQFARQHPITHKTLSVIGGFATLLGIWAWLIIVTA